MKKTKNGYLWEKDKIISQYLYAQYIYLCPCVAEMLIRGRVVGIQGQDGRICPIQLGN